MILVFGFLLSWPFAVFFAASKSLVTLFGGRAGDRRRFLRSQQQGMLLIGHSFVRSNVGIVVVSHCSPHDGVVVEAPPNTQRHSK